MYIESATQTETIGWVGDCTVTKAIPQNLTVQVFFEIIALPKQRANGVALGPNPGALVLHRKSTVDNNRNAAYC